MTNYGYTYISEYSGQRIYNKNLTTVYNLLYDLNDMGWIYNDNRIGTGLGCIQWSFGRSYILVSIYREVTNNGSTITQAQALAAEGLMVLRELNSSYKYVYNNWETANASDLNSQTAAYNAAFDICVDYESPDDANSKANDRGNLAKLIYNDMVGY